jgi:hypothetical protein
MTIRSQKYLVAALSLALLAALGAVGSVDAKRRAELMKSRQPLSAGALNPQLERGKIVFQKYGCNACHGPAGQGGIKNINAQTGGEVNGLLHVSDMSWVRKVSHPNEVVEKGQTVECKVLSVDQQRRRIDREVVGVGDREGIRGGGSRSDRRQCRRRDGGGHRIRARQRAPMLPSFTRLVMSGRTHGFTVRSNPSPKCTRVLRPLTSTPRNLRKRPTNAQSSANHRRQRLASLCGARPQKIATGTRSTSNSGWAAAAATNCTRMRGARTALRRVNTPAGRIKSK